MITAAPGCAWTPAVLPCTVRPTPDQPHLLNLFLLFNFCRWMDKQEAAFKAWLNAALVPVAADSGSSSSGSEGPLTAPGGLASRRLVARLRGLLWQLYSQDQELIR